MANEELDELLSSLDNKSDNGTKHVTAQESLRDRMLKASKAESEESSSNREEELTQEIIDEEVDEENKPAINPKVVIIAIVAVLAVSSIAIMFGVSNSKKRKLEQAQREAEEQAALSAQEALANAVVEEDTGLEVSWGAIEYTDEQKNLLKAQGYSDEEIVNFQNSAIDFTYPYFTALEKYYAYQLDNMLPLYDNSSDEYKDMIGDTWLSLNKRTDLVEWTDDYMAYSREEKQNLDYEKIEPYGNQLFLKIYLDADTHDSFFLLNISPQEWNQLDDAGNVVVNYTYSTHYKPYENVLEAVEDEQNIFITQASLDIIESLKNRNSSDSSDSSESSGD